MIALHVIYDNQNNKVASFQSITAALLFLETHKDKVYILKHR